MKALKAFMTAAAIIPMLTACLDDENSQAGFTNVAVTTPYANVTSGYIGFASYGEWVMTQTSGNEWCTITKMQGSAYLWEPIAVKFELNTTGKQRSAGFKLQDANNSNVYMNFTLMQYATRGDGSLGSSPLVREITGDDGSKIEVSYDALCRPTTLRMEKNGSTFRDLNISYSETDSTMLVDNGTNTLSGKYANGYQPDQLCSETDTVGYVYQTNYDNSHLAFNVEEHKESGEKAGQALLLKNQNLSPDSEHTADSLQYAHIYSDGSKLVERMQLSYSDNSNRCQSLDVNQLLLGVEECNPYVLLGFFRHARNSKIISEASTDSGKFTVSTTLNADNSVNTMTVTDKQGQKVTYTFSYQ